MFGRLGTRVVWGEGSGTPLHLTCFGAEPPASPLSEVTKKYKTFRGVPDPSPAELSSTPSCGHLPVSPASFRPSEASRKACLGPCPQALAELVFDPVDGGLS